MSVYREVFLEGFMGGDPKGTHSTGDRHLGPDPCKDRQKLPVCNLLASVGPRMCGGPEGVFSCEEVFTEILTKLGW